MDIMNGDDERDYAEEAANRRLQEDGGMLRPKPPVGSEQWHKEWRYEAFAAGWILARAKATQAVTHLLAACPVSHHERREALGEALDAINALIKDDPPGAR